MRRTRSPRASPPTTAISRIPNLREWQYAPWSSRPDISGEVEYVQTPEMLDHKYPDRLYVTCDGEGLSPAVGENVGPHIARHDPTRVLAECEAKRRIVALHETVRAAPGRDQWTCAECGSTTHPCATLRALAAIYADHPDYNESWRP